MSESNWTVATSSLSTGDVDRGVTGGIDRPNGGGSFTYGFNSLAVADGAVALFANQAGFAPTASGMRISGAMKRHPGGGPTGWASFLFAGLQGSGVDDVGYMLGLSDASPAKIILRKGALNEGFPSETVDPSVNGVLAIGTVSVAQDTWVHLRLDMVVNLNGDVILNVFESDLVANPVTAPVFAPVPGMDVLDAGSGRAFFDDTLGVNSGSQPFLLGRVGFGFRVENVARRSFFDHITVGKQL